MTTTTTTAASEAMILDLSNDAIRVITEQEAMEVSEEEEDVYVEVVGTAADEVSVCKEAAFRNCQ